MSSTSDQGGVSFKVPSVSDLGQLVEQFDQHPLGAGLFILFVIAVALCIWAWRSGKGPAGGA